MAPNSSGDPNVESIEIIELHKQVHMLKAQCLTALNQAKKSSEREEFALLQAKESDESAQAALLRANHAAT